MSDLALFFGTIVGLAVIGGIIFFLETFGKCKHKFGRWTHEELPHAYVQFRQCEKCGYRVGEQWRKIGEQQ